jgi:hypothetical protein
MDPGQLKRLARNDAGVGEPPAQPSNPICARFRGSPTTSQYVSAPTGLTPTR